MSARGYGPFFPWLSYESTDSSLSACLIFFSFSKAFYLLPNPSILLWRWSVPLLWRPGVEALKGDAVSESPPADIGLDMSKFDRLSRAAGYLTFSLAGPLPNRACSLYIKGRLATIFFYFVAGELLTDNYGFDWYFSLFGLLLYDRLLPGLLNLRPGDRCEKDLSCEMPAERLNTGNLSLSAASCLSRTSSLTYYLILVFCSNNLFILRAIFSLNFILLHFKYYSFEKSYPW